MKKLLTFIFFFFSLISVHAQSQDLQDEMKVVVHRVDSLEHELSYLKLTYEVSNFISQLENFGQDLNIRSLEIKLYTLNRSFDSELLDVVQYNLNSLKNKRLALTFLSEAMKNNFPLKLAASTCTDSEQYLLKTQYDLIDGCLEQIDSSMNLLELVVSEYKECVLVMENSR